MRVAAAEHAPLRCERLPIAQLLDLEDVLPLPGLPPELRARYAAVHRFRRGRVMARHAGLNLREVVIELRAPPVLMLNDRPARRSEADHVGVKRDARP
jgi:hypothetical protein